jgi:hypothetical protein
MVSSLETASQFRNRAFTCERQRTETGDILITLHPTAQARKGARRTAIFVYQVAAELERRSEELNAPWVIAPDVRAGHIVVGLPSENEYTAAHRMLDAALGDLGL